jgi:endonuclease/exonuclease/phosphatase family metal-dependent hydrolase
MRLLLYNIRYGAGTGRRFHFPFPYSGYLKPVNGNFEKIVNYIKSAQPDIIGLVETDFGSYRVEHKNQAERIAGELGHQAVFESKYNIDSMMGRVPLLNKQGNALLTNRTIQEKRFHYFQDGVKRLIIEVELDDVTIFLVHLSLKYRHRQFQLHDLQCLVAACTKPVIVAGDFNALWGERELQLFLSATGMTSANTHGTASWPSRAPLLQLDYIFHTPQIRTRHFHSPQIRLSDHLPFVWDFEIERTEPALKYTTDPAIAAGYAYEAPVIVNSMGFPDFS